jgi:integrase/recombinase XerD
VSSWYGYLEADEILPRSPFVRVARPKVQRRYGETPALTRGEAQALLSAAEDAGPRTHVAVGILLETAIRADELLTLDVSGIRVRQTMLTIRVDRKGGESDVLPLPERLAHDVHELRGDRREGPLLANEAGGPWTYAQLHHAIGKAGAASGISERVTPHVCRATWATLAIEDGESLATVQDVMGHSSADTTRIYDRGRDDIERKAKAVERVSVLIRKGPAGA